MLLEITKADILSSTLGFFNNSPAGRSLTQLFGLTDFWNLSFDKLGIHFQHCIFCDVKFTLPIRDDVFYYLTKWYNKEKVLPVTWEIPELDKYVFDLAISVTDQDYLSGRQTDGYDCPVAKATLKALDNLQTGLKFTVFVGHKYIKIRINDNLGWCNIKLSEQVQLFISNFDRDIIIDETDLPKFSQLIINPKVFIT